MWIKRNETEKPQSEIKNGNDTFVSNYTMQQGNRRSYDGKEYQVQ